MRREEYMVKHIERCRICRMVWGVYMGQLVTEEDMQVFEFEVALIEAERANHEIEAHTLLAQFLQTLTP